MTGGEPGPAGVGEPGVEGQGGPRAVLLTGSGCSLCGPARRVLAEVATELGEPWEERDLAAYPELRERYRTLIPVLLVDGREVAHWRLDPAQVRRALRRRRWRRLRRGTDRTAGR